MNWTNTIYIIYDNDLKSRKIKDEKSILLQIQKL
jgi:hypothetical protein